MKLYDNRKHQRESLAAHEALGFFDVGRGHAFVAVAIQQSLQELPNRFLVVHHEDGRGIAIRYGRESRGGTRLMCFVRQDRYPPKGLSKWLNSVLYIFDGFGRF